MSYSVALNFEDGATRFIQCGGMETVADAAYRSGVNIPIDCREGACGTCKCRVESGQFKLGDYVEDALSRAEFEQGYALACQMRPTGDCVVLVAASSAACNTREEAYETVVEEVRALSDSTFSLVLSGPRLSQLVFLPGQYAKLHIPGTDEFRSYSFSSMGRPDQISFLIRNVPGGRMSTYLLKEARPGDALRVTGPLGGFYLRDVKRPVLMLAGGTGLAPFLAMLDKLVAQGGASHPIHLIYGVNTDGDVVEFERLQAFTQRLAGFSFDVCVVDKGSQYPRKGYVTQHMLPEQLHGGNVDIYLCGPPPMVEAVAKHLQDNALASSAFLYEKFAPSAV